MCSSWLLLDEVSDDVIFTLSTRFLLVENNLFNYFFHSRIADNSVKKSLTFKLRVKKGTDYFEEYK